MPACAGMTGLVALDGASGIQPALTGMLLRFVLMMNGKTSQDVYARTRPR